MMRILFLSLFFTTTLFTTSVFSQEFNAFNIDRFADITNTEDEFSSENITARMIEGLGFRYYWATAGLTTNDLEYKPSKSGRSSLETIEHLNGLSRFMLDFLKITSEEAEQKSNYQSLRASTLMNLEMIERKLKSMKTNEFEAYKMGDITFWQFINGPVADAIYHTGQLVMMRRASGNPITEGVNVLMGVKN